VTTEGSDSSLPPMHGALGADLPPEVAHEMRRAQLGAEHARLHVALLAEAGDLLSAAVDSETLQTALKALGASVVPAFADWFAVHLVDEWGEWGEWGGGVSGATRPVTTPVATPVTTLVTTPVTTPDGTPHPHPDGERLIRGVSDHATTALLMDLPPGREGLRGFPGPDTAQRVAPAAGIGSMVIAPIPVPPDDARSAAGALSFVTFPERRGLRPSDLEIARGLAQRVSVALERIRLIASERLSRLRIEAIVDASPVAITELDSDGCGVWWNEAATQLFGWPSRSSSRRPWRETPLEHRPTMPRDGEQLLSLFDSARQGDRSVGSEVELVLGGSRRSLSIAVAPISGADTKVERILVVAEDVTERRRIAKRLGQIERLNVMTQLAAGVAHDFNNLLTVILGSTEALRASVSYDPQASRPVRDEIEDDLSAIERAGRRAAALTAQLLDLNSASSESSVPGERLDLDEMVASLTPSINRLLGKEMSFDHVRARDPSHIVAGRAGLERVILNLVLNARDAMSPGGRLVIATTYEEDDERVELSVTDTGSGMDEATAARCFEPFFTTKEPTQGSGLGLAGVMALVTQAGGEIGVVTKTGQGSRFTLSFPTVR